MALRVGVVSLSSPVGPVELEQGLERLRRAGFDVVVHPHALNRAFVNAGTDMDRATSLVDYAYDDAIDVVWCARGGYGAARVAGLLDELTRGRPEPKQKTLVGYSDVTFLHEVVRQRWGWRTIHAPMVSANPPPSDAEFDAAVAMVCGETPKLPYHEPTLRFLHSPARDSSRQGAHIIGELIGGNLCLWATLAGTPWMPNTRGRILFFEDLGEKLYRLDRYVVQIEQAGMFEGVEAIVLGDFTDCDDESPTMLSPDGTSRVPLRPTMTLQDGIAEMFGRVARKFDIPLAVGLPVGHGPSYWPLELGAKHTLTRDGRLFRSRPDDGG